MEKQEESFNHLVAKNCTYSNIHHKKCKTQ